MRKHVLLSATAIGLILSGLMALPAAADTEISSSITTPTKTSVAGNVTVDVSAQITLTSGTAITVDSDNTVTLNGAIYMGSSDDNSTAILVDGGHTSGLTIGNNITVTDNYTPSDTLPAGALDGIADAPFATGNGRYGVHSLGTTPFNGNVTFNSPYIMQIEGNNSYGFRFENQLNGNFSTAGTLNVVGDNNTAISLEKGVTGNVYVSGTINSFGTGSKAVNLNGDIGGGVEIDATISGSGYATISPSSTLTADQIKALPAIDLQQSGPLITISGNVAKGILINTVPTTDSTNTSTDQDGDGITDTAQTSGALAQNGSAPALLIGSSTAPITIGGVVYNSSAVNPPAINYGLLVRGSVSASGLYTGISGTTVQIGGLGQAVTIANGIGLTGQISSAASNGDAVGLLLGSGATTPQLDILSGGISVSSTSSLGNTAYGLDINPGASLQTINIKASSGFAVSGIGSTSGSIAIRDQSNTLATINSNGYINSVRTGTDDDADGFLDKILHPPLAIDTHTNSIGLTFNMVDTAPDDDTISAPIVSGGFALGSGDDHINFNGGAMAGDIDFGAGANSFVLDGGSLYTGKLTSSGTVNLDLVKGETDLTAAGATLNLTNLHVGAESTLAITADTLHPTVPVFAVTGGSAVFDSGAKLDVQLNSMLLTPQTFTLITAPSINLGTINTNLDGNVPYIYHATLNQTATTLTADFRLKTQAEGAYSDNQFSALIPVLTAAGQDPDGFSAIITQFTKDNFDAVFNQYLPDFSGENLLTLSKGNEALNQSLAALTMIPDNNGGQYWLQEYGFQTVRKKGYTNGFKSTTFSFAGGRETRLNDYNMAGVYIGLTSGNPLDSYAVGQETLTDSDLTVGGYWRMNTGAFKTWAHAGLGFVQVESTRVILNTHVSRIAKARWDGYSYSAGAGASYAMRTGFIDVTPQILVDYYNLNEAKHTETGGSDFFDLVVAERNSNMLSSQALINVSYNQWFVKPELWVGWRQNITADIADTVANFPNGTPFTLKGGDVAGGGPVAGFRFSADNQWSFFSLEGSYSKLDAYTDFSLSLRTRFQF